MELKQKKIWELEEKVRKLRNKKRTWKEAVMDFEAAGHKRKPRP